MRQPLRLALALVSCLGAPAFAAGLLTGQLPSSTEPGTPVVRGYTDEAVAFDGARWDAPEAVRIPAGGWVQWDIGRVEPIRGAAIQADNNDEYILSVSELGIAWVEVWRAPAVGQAGLQTRETMSLDTRGRYVRITPVGGDGMYSVSELEVFATQAQRDRSVLLRSKWIPRHPLDVAWTWALAITALALFVVGRRSPRALVGVAVVGLLTGAGWLFDTAVVKPPTVEAPRLDFMRAAVAGLALLAVGRSLVWRRQHPAHPALVTGVLGATALFGLLCFLNLGRPQFFDHGQGKPTFIHNYDMRTYFPIAKYFKELRFDGVYAASAAVVAESRGGLDSVADVRFRDLRTHQMTDGRAARQHIEAVRARFDDARWADFTVDMNYFRRAMGDGSFLGSMQDHGGNATPVWFLAAKLLFGFAPASSTALGLGVVIDALLVLLGFAALWWAFGARTALLAATIFGAMDFYMFGTNWFGAALRHDWLAFWCIGLAALKKERYRAAGAFFAWSALIRAFPALTFVTLAMPALWDAGVRLSERRFAWRDWLAAHRAVVEVAVGAVVAGGALFLASSAVFGFDAWLEWLRKVSLLNADPHVNNIAVQTYLAAGVWEHRLVALLGLGAVLVAVRRAPLVEAAAFGVVLLPVVFNPANYYLHAAFLLVVLGRERRDAPDESPIDGGLQWLALLAMCVASYFTTLTADTASHFRFETWNLMVVLLFIWGVQLWRTQQVEREAST